MTREHPESPAARTTPTSALCSLPEGFQVTLRQDVVRADGGRVLIGGSPKRAARLSERARSMFAGEAITVTDGVSARLARRLLDADLAVPVLDHFEVSAADVTVVIPVRDRPDQLARCLAAIVPLPVIVVDDASRDPEQIERVARRFGADLVRLRVNVGPAGARNAGLSRVTTPLVAFVDSDVVADGAALLDLARNCRDPRVALAGPRVVGRTRSSSPRWFERYDAVASSLDLGDVGGLVRPGATIGWLPAACLVGRVAHLGGGFDEALRVAEDVDLVWRLGDEGLSVRYDPTVVVRHDVRPTVQEWLGRKFAYGTGGADLALRHGSRIAPAVLALPTAVSAAALLQRRWWSLPVAAVSVLTTTRSLRSSLPVDDGATSTALRLSVDATGWALRQESALLLRHWWPAAAVASVFSRKARRAVVTAVVVDLVATSKEPRGTGRLAHAVARRLDDLAYGAGLWWGAIRSGRPGCLAARRAGRPEGRPGASIAR